MEDSQLIEELVNIVGPKRIYTDPEQLERYNGDAYSVQKALPRAVVIPENTEEVVKIVKLLNRAGVPFLARGAGTGLSGGAIPLHHEVVISMMKMNKLLSVDLDNMRAVVQPGLVTIKLTRKIKDKGYYFAPDPSSEALCTIGGNFAENAGGAHCLKYGVSTNHIVAAEVVLPDGELVHIGSEFGDQEGYDLLGLLVGSEGTLGIVTAITVKIMKSPEAVKTVLAMFDHLEDASSAVSNIIGAGIIPAAMELMDQATMAACDKGDAPVGYPTDIEAVVLIEVDGLAAGVVETSERIVEICEKHHVRTVKVAVSDEERALWWQSRKAAFISLGKTTPNYITLDGVVPRTKLTWALGRIKELSETFGLRVSNVFHAGDGNLHPHISYDASVPGETEKALSLGGEILKVCVEAGGSISGEHGVGVEKLEHMHFMFADNELEAQIDIRSFFNPHDLCNPGKLIPSSGKCVEVKQASWQDKRKKHAEACDDRG